MNKKRILLIIPIVLILLSVHLLSRFGTIEDNLSYQYGTPIANIEITDEDNQLILFSMADNIGLTTYKSILGFYHVKDDYGHVKVGEDIYVVLSDRGLETLVLWGKINVGTDDVKLILKKDDRKVVLDVTLSDQYLCETIDPSLELDGSWQLSMSYKVADADYLVENIVIKKDY